eukprot:7255103-Alexandrium_andersonii.AAC.1
MARQLALNADAPASCANPGPAQSCTVVAPPRQPNVFSSSQHVWVIFERVWAKSVNLSSSTRGCKIVVA